VQEISLKEFRNLRTFCRCFYSHIPKNFIYDALLNKNNKNEKKICPLLTLSCEIIFEWIAPKLSYPTLRNLRGSCKSLHEALPGRLYFNILMKTASFPFLGFWTPKIVTLNNESYMDSWCKTLRRDCVNDELHYIDDHDKNKKRIRKLFINVQSANDMQSGDLTWISQP
jgi:hypothetical protein